MILLQGNSKVNEFGKGCERGFRGEIIIIMRDTIVLHTVNDLAYNCETGAFVHVIIFYFLKEFDTVSDQNNISYKHFSFEIDITTVKRIRGFLQNNKGK